MAERDISPAEYKDKAHNIEDNYKQLMATFDEGKSETVQQQMFKQIQERNANSKAFDQSINQMPLKPYENVLQVQ